MSWLANILIVSCMLLAAVQAEPGTTAEKVVRLSAPNDHPLREVAVRVLTLAYGELGYHVDAVSLPPARSLYMANEGQVDGELFRGDRIERDFKRLIRIPVAVGAGEIVVLAHRSREDIVVDSWEDLAPYTIGVQLGIKTVQMHTEGYNRSFVAEADQLILQLLHGRIDVAVGPRDIFLLTLNNMVLEGVNEKLPLTDIVFLEPPVETGYLYHYLHESQIELALAITRVMTRLEEEGVIERIHNEVMADRYRAFEQLH